MFHHPLQRVPRAALIMSLALASCSATANDTVLNEAWRLLQEADRAREQEDRLRRERQLRGQPKPVDPPDAHIAAPCVAVGGLRVAGNTLLPDKRLRQVVEPHAAACMSVAQVNKLLVAITAAYVNEGYITARPYLARPLAAEEVVDVVILEGYVESVELADPALPVSMENAFGDLPGAPLHLPTLERGLDQLNRLRAFDVAGDILPGTAPGASRIVITSLGHQPRAWAAVSADNRGSKSAGRERIVSHVGVDSPLQWNDALSASFSRTLPNNGSFSRTLGLGYSVPRGPWQLSLGASHYQYRSYIQHLKRPIATTGHGALYSASAERQLWRSGNAIFNASARISRKQTDTSVAGRRIKVQSPSYNVAELQLDLLWLDDAIWNAQLQYSEGLGGWSANDGQRAPRSHAPEGRFQRWRATLGRTRTGQIGTQPWQWSSQWMAQYSDDSLPVIEQLSLAGDASVRGFRDASTYHGRGITWNNTLAFPNRLSAVGTATPRIGLDMGIGEGRDQARGDRLAGAALGVTLGHKALQLDLDYQHPLYRKLAETGDGYWQVQISVRF